VATNAERLRRHRAHHRGDHSLCRPEFCPDAEAAAPPPVRLALPPAPEPAPERERTPEQPAERGASAQALWDELSPHLSAAHRVLLTQACRIVDRLDELEALIDGRNRRGVWLQLAKGEDGVIRVVVDDLLAESRQQATALKGLMAELRQAGALGSGRSKPPTKGDTGGIASLVDAAARRRASSR